MALRMGIPLISLALWAFPVMAEEVVIDRESVGTCLQEESSAADPGRCVTAAHESCFLYPPDEAAASATLCFREAAPQWGALIAERMQALQAALPADGYAAVQINARYDLLANMLQCERMTALSEAGGMEADLRTLQQARCEATASGLVYVRLARIDAEPDAGPEE
ncbi:hypothetical protein [Salipiger sp.]|uniref:hypothetical protein n=1 Tax=Salipiger sp. TaxID=2078585 RepID=UPI003A97493F